MKIALINESSDANITRPLCDAIAAAVENQVLYHYGPAWDSPTVGTTVRFYENPADIPDDKTTAKLVIVDRDPVDGALGWHTVNGVGRAFGRILWEPIRAHGGTLTEGNVSLSSVISHEVLEMVGNPYVNFWAKMPDGTLDAIELGDRVQAFSYEVDGISVSNFLRPRSFRIGDGPYDYLEVTSRPFEIAPGGYAIREKDGAAFHIWDDGMPMWLREMKLASVRLPAAIHPSDG